MSLYKIFLQDNFRCDTYVALREQYRMDKSDTRFTNLIYIKKNDHNVVFNMSLSIPQEYSGETFLCCSPLSIRVGYIKIDHFVSFVKHRWDGPAEMAYHGGNCWFFNGKSINTDELYFWADDNDIDLDNLTKDDINLMKLYWG